MTQEKELLLKDLYARLPYDPVVEYKGEVYNVLGIVHGRLVLCKPFASCTLEETPLIEEVKPYLFSISSMTEEIMDEIYNNTGVYDIDVLSPVHIEVGTTFEDLTKITDILHKHHIDYRDLIPMGLANDARRLNIYGKIYTY